MMGGGCCVREGGCEEVMGGGCCVREGGCEEVMGGGCCVREGGCEEVMGGGCLCSQMHTVNVAHHVCCVEYPQAKSLQYRLQSLQMRR